MEKLGVHTDLVWLADFCPDTGTGFKFFELRNVFESKNQFPLFRDAPAAKITHWPKGQLDLGAPKVNSLPNGESPELYRHCRR